MDLLRNGTDKTGTGQIPFTRQILSEPFVFLSEPFHLFRSCKRALKLIQLLGYEAWEHNTKEMYHSLLSLKMISFDLFPYASEPSMNFNFLKLVLYRMHIIFAGSNFEMR